MHHAGRASPELATGGGARSRTSVRVQVHPATRRSTRNRCPNRTARPVFERISAIAERSPVRGSRNRQAQSSAPAARCNRRWASDPHSGTARRSLPRDRRRSSRRRSSCGSNRSPQVSHQLGHTAGRQSPVQIVFEQHKGIPVVHRPPPRWKEINIRSRSAGRQALTVGSQYVQRQTARLCSLRSAMTPPRPTSAGLMSPRSSRVLGLRRRQPRSVWVAQPGCIRHARFRSIVVLLVPSAGAHPRVPRRSRASSSRLHPRLDTRARD